MAAVFLKPWPELLGRKRREKENEREADLVSNPHVLKVKVESGSPPHHLRKKRPFGVTT